jgi:tRNA A37 threonylcarbamoyladenosine synthetase subunit TsaC/SUA5/YrdC
LERAAGPARLPGVSKVLLVQTDTTVGFVSQNAGALVQSKKRPSDKPFLKTFASLQEYKRTGRVPTQFKRELRRRTKTTYIIKDTALRIVPDGHYHRLLRPYGWLYSTSANASGKRFDPVFANAVADIVVENSEGLYEDIPSSIFRLNHTKKQKIR